MIKKQKDLAVPVGVTLDRFIKKKQDEFPFATGELSQLLRDIALAAKIVHQEISRSGLNGIEGSYGEQNIQGENQQKLDVIANIRFVRALRNGGEVCAVISEEVEEIIHLSNKDAKYIVAMDPLDGSSNIDVNVSIGTIFSIYRRKTKPGTLATETDFLQTGREQVAAGYILYGSSAMLVYTTGHGVNGFTYDPFLGEFFLSHPDIKTPETGNIYSINEGYFDYFEPEIQDFIHRSRKKGVTSRYIGSLVADFHRNLLKGGIYLYPETKQNPHGKLRLIYECNALALIAEQAGGAAFSGTQKTLDIQPESFHQRVPLFLGSKKMVKDILQSKKLVTNA